MVDIIKTTNCPRKVTSVSPLFGFSTLSVFLRLNIILNIMKHAKSLKIIKSYIYATAKELKCLIYH